MRLIDADMFDEALKQAQNECRRKEGGNFLFGFLSKVRANLEKMPTVDAVPVVRCKDCKYSHITYVGECKYCDYWQEESRDALYLPKDFYCAGGEKE